MAQPRVVLVGAGIVGCALADELTERGWTDVTGNATGELFQKFGSVALFDVSASYRFDEHFNLRVGAENVANTYPAEATNQAVRGLIYSRNAPYDTDGGQYYVRVGMNF